ncbi:cation transporting ATPase C-terminal domain-containing protein [Halomonas sp. LBP4]|uniref:cation transporting ATPase C-terminal domain-containing protein n=1 Tax=Halomonas sp. LBP4 TaxID=2044917 RepID=UPI0035A0541E
MARQPRDPDASLINSRFLIHSSLSMTGIFGSRPVWIAIALVVALQLAWTYLPFMQLIFGSAALGLVHWLVILAGSVAILLIVELEKWVLRRRTTGGARPVVPGAPDTARPRRADIWHHSRSWANWLSSLGSWPSTTPQTIRSTACCMSWRYLRGSRRIEQGLALLDTLPEPRIGKCMGRHQVNRPLEPRFQCRLEGEESVGHLDRG